MQYPKPIFSPSDPNTSVITNTDYDTTKEVVALREARFAAGRRPPAWVVIKHAEDCNIFTSSAKLSDHNCTPLLVISGGSLPITQDWSHLKLDRS